MVQSGCKSCTGGSGHTSRKRSGSLNLSGVGSSRLATVETGPNQARRSGETPDDEKLNHYQGAKALAGEIDGRRNRNGKDRC